MPEPLNYETPPRPPKSRIFIIIVAILVAVAILGMMFVA